MTGTWFEWRPWTAAQARRRLKAADAARDGRDWAAAAQHYAAYLALRPSDWGIQVQLGHVLKEGGALPEAEAAYRAGAAAAPDDADVLLHLGYLLKATSRATEAEAVFRRCSELLDRQPSGARTAEMRRAVLEAADQPLRVLGDAARDARNWLEAARHYRAHLEAHASDAGIWVQLGNVSKEALQFGTAENAYRRAMENDAEQPEALLQLGHLLKLQNRRDEALQAYREAAELGGGTAAVREFSALLAELGHSRGTAFAPRMLVDPPESLAAHSGALADVPPAVLTAAALRILLDAQAARDAGAWDAACSSYEAYLAEQPVDAAIWLEFATALCRVGRHQAAYGALTKIALPAPDMVAVKREKVLLLRLLGRYGEAEELLFDLMVEKGLAEGGEDIALSR